MIRLFDSDTTASIVCDKGAPEAVVLALRDLQRNLRTLANRETGFEICLAGSDPAIRVATDPSIGSSEAYTIRVCDAEITIMGSDTLGTVYGIYAFTEKCLGILPFYRLTDLFPEKCREKWLEEQTITSPERSVRFRGWFLNDEDLLSEFRYSGGHREIDYPFYRDIMDTDVLDRILETALRMEINLVIPASFLNIDNPDEARLADAVTRRGLYISQHHVEPVGVSYFSADAYVKRFGNDGEQVSFLSNRERMVEIWRYYIEKWAKYGDRVIWQLGLRGKAD